MSHSETIFDYINTNTISKTYLRLVDSIESKEKEIESIQQKMERQKITIPYLIQKNFKGNINNFIKKIQKIKTDIVQSENFLEKDIIVEYYNQSLNISYQRYENDNEYNNRLKSLNFRLEKLKEEIQESKTELDILQSNYEIYSN